MARKDQERRTLGKNGPRTSEECYQQKEVVMDWTHAKKAPRITSQSRHCDGIRQGSEVGEGRNTLGEGEWKLRWRQRVTISVGWKRWPKTVSDGSTLLMAFAPPWSKGQLMMMIHKNEVLAYGSSTFQQAMQESV